MKRPAPLAGLWQSDKGLSAMLVFLCLALFVGAPLADAGSAGELAFDVLFSLLLVSGVVFVGKRRALDRIRRRPDGRNPRPALGGAPVARLGDAAGGASRFSIALLLILAALVLVQVFREGPITAYRIQGAIVVYLLVGFAWAAAYELVYRAWPGGFQFAQRGASDLRISHGLLYYSFVTLTTLGYGDITPVHPAARSLATGEALVGQLYPAILIARLVSMRISPRRRDA